MLTEIERATLADALWAAERARSPIPPLVASHPDMTTADAYQIQLRNIHRRHIPVVGHKVGLSSVAMQQMMGVHEPDYGHLLEDMRLHEEVPVDASRFCYPRVEIEVAFLLGKDLPGETCTEDDVLAATEAFAPSIELIDSRIADWRISIADTIADNASSAAFVVGRGRVAPAAIDIKSIDAVLTRNGEVVAQGRSDAVLGNPVTAVAWLARTVATFGVRLHAGHIILPGACARAVDARPGDDFHATFAGLGDVSLSFVESTGGAEVGKALAAIVGSGNIGTDLLYKLQRSELIEPRWMVGIDPDSPGLKRAADLGLETTSDGVDVLFAGQTLPDLVFEATSAYVHRANAPRYEAAGIRAVDLTPAALGPAVVPSVNLDANLDAPNVNMITCGGQATIPMVYAVSRVTPVSYAEIVATVASRSAGPGTRANIDEFTRTTSMGIETIGGAARGKAIIVLNPADPPMVMRDTIFCAVAADVDADAVAASIRSMVADVATYVPGYRLLQEPQFDPPSPATGGSTRVAIFIEVEGMGEFLPPYAGNLDIMTAAATRVGEELARRR